jgi:hypothetical protein
MWHIFIAYFSEELIIICMVKDFQMNVNPRDAGQIWVASLNMKHTRLMFAPNIKAISDSIKYRKGRAAKLGAGARACILIQDWHAT